jgi:hypothetical protein
MNKGLCCCLSVVVLLGALGPALPRPMAAAPVAPVESGVYEEDFSSYAAKEYAENAVWDMWNGNLVISLRDASEQRYPCVASDGYGGSFVVWIDERKGNPDIYAQRLDVNGNRLWPTEVKINVNSEPVWRWSLSITADATGNLFVVWVDRRDGVDHIYAQKLGRNGSRIWPQDVRVSISNANQSSPFVGIDSFGNAIVTWSDARNSSSRRTIYAQKLSSSGIRLWAQDIQVNMDNGNRSHLAPVIIAGNNNDFFVAWKCGLDGYINICIQRIQNDGTIMWSSDKQIDDVGQVSAFVTDPITTVFTGDGVFVAWVDERNDYGDIYANKINLSGIRVWPIDVRVDNAIQHTKQGHPSAVALKNGEVLVTWNDTRSQIFNDADVYAQRITAGGERVWDEDRSVQNDTSFSGQWWPHATKTTNDTIAVVWLDSRNAETSIYSQLIDDNAHRLWSRDVRVELPQGSVVQGNPVLAIMSESTSPYLVWVDGRDGLPGVFLQQISQVRDRVWPQDVRVSNSNSAKLYHANPSISVSKNNTLMVAWETDDNDGSINPYIYMQHIDRLGNLLWSADLLLNQNAQLSESAIAFGSGRSVFVGWASAGRVFLQRVDDTGTLLWGEDLLVSDIDYWNSNYPPLVVSDEYGNAIIVWEHTDYGNGTKNILMQRVNDNGYILWHSPIQVVMLEEMFWGRLTDIVSLGDQVCVAWTDRPGQANYNSYILYFCGFYFKH